MEEPPWLNVLPLKNIQADLNIFLLDQGGISWMDGIAGAWLHA